MVPIPLYKSTLMNKQTHDRTTLTKSATTAGLQQTVWVSPSTASRALTFSPTYQELRLPWYWHGIRELQSMFNDHNACQQRSTTLRTSLDQSILSDYWLPVGSFCFPLIAPSSQWVRFYTKFIITGMRYDRASVSAFAVCTCPSTDSISATLKFPLESSIINTWNYSINGRRPLNMRLISLRISR